MGESPDKSAGDGEKAESDAIKASASQTSGTDSEKQKVRGPDSNLPVVWSPKLGADDGPNSIETTDEVPAFGTGEDTPPPDDDTLKEDSSEAAATAPAPQSRFALLAATIALVAAMGSFLGSLTASGIARLLPAQASAASTKATNTADASDVLQAVKAQLAELSALKANIDGANRNANSQFAKIADRLDRLDKLDKHTAAAASAPETTGSIPAVPVPAPAAALEPKPAVIDGWIVQDVENGRALVATRYGGVFEVGAGSFLPGIGRVEGIKREDGRWVVVTAHGVITSMHQ